MKLNRRQWVAAVAATPLAVNFEAFGARPARIKISSMKVTLVASPDYALLNSWDVHGTHFTRTILELETSDGHKGISEVSGGTFRALEAARPVVVGRDPFEIEYFRRAIKSVAAFGAVEVACLDIIGKVFNRRVADLLGGAYREAAPYSAYVFFVMPTPDGPDITTPEAVTQEFVDFSKKYGFTSCKFKGGVLHPDQEIEALERMRAALPASKLRIDPNAAWSIETSVRVAKRVESLNMEYLEDPTAGQDGMAAVRRQTKIPLATNMCVTQMEHIAPGFQKGAIDIVLLDNHYMGGLNNVRYWAAICEALGWGCSGHSNNHLGISMATMTHMNCAISRVTYDADSHYPWTTDDIIRGGKLEFKDGKMALPEGPGLGVEIEPDRMAALKENMSRAKTRHDLLAKWDPKYPRNSRTVRW